MVESVSKQTLQDCYNDVTKKNGLLDFISIIRGPKNDQSGKYHVKQHDLDHLFSSSVWTDIGKKGGHRKLIHKVTKVVIEYADHSNNIDPGAAREIFNQIQEHVNILGNNIFKIRSWKQEPDYTAALTNAKKI